VLVFLVVGADWWGGNECFRAQLNQRMRKAANVKLDCESVHDRSPKIVINPRGVVRLGGCKGLAR